MNSLFSPPPTHRSMPGASHRNRMLLLCCAVGLLAILVLGLRGGAAAQTNAISFGYGRGIQMIDPDGLNRAPIWVNTPNVTVNYSLFPLAPADFTERYASDKERNRPIDLTGLTPAFEWQQIYSDTTPMYDYGRSSFADLPSDAPAGLFALSADAGSAGSDSMLVVIGRHVLMMKRAAGGQVVTWASQLQDRVPTPGMVVTLYDAQGGALGQATTNSDGVASFSNGAQAVMAVGQYNGELTVAGLDWDWISQGAYWYWDWSGAQAGVQRIYLYTDRPIYRPGQTIHYQAFIRRLDQGAYSKLDVSTPISVTLYDARNNVAGVQSVTLDAFGSVAGEFLLSDAPPLGDYHLELTVNGQTQRQPLRVEEYRKPEYKVEITPSTSHPIAGDNVVVTVDATYFFEQPVANAQVVLKIHRSPIYRYWDGWWRGPSSVPGDSTTEITGVTDANGRWSTTFTADADQQWDASYTLQAAVTDARNLPVEGSALVTAHWNALQLGVSTTKWGYSTDEAVTVDVVAQQHDGASIVGQPVTVRILTYDWNTQTGSDAAPAQSAQTDSLGRAQLVFTGLPQGWYRIEATTTDARNRTASMQSYLWVFDLAAQDWWFNSNDQISILPDKASYAAGEVAHLLIQSRATGMALLTLERDGVFSEQIVTIDGPVTSVDVPISEELAPNVFARIHLFRPTAAGDSEQNAEGRLLLAQTELVVPAISKRLNITISADAERYAAGGQAVLTLQVTNAAQQPVQARVGLALVDEAIFALQSDLSADLFDTFYGRQPLQVNTYDSLVRRPYNWWMLPVEDILSPPPAVDNGQPEGSPAPQTQVRRRFVDTAYWNPTITTDATGKATVIVPLPDNLTTWRIIARAITAGAKIGEARDKLLVTQEILARPALPRFGVIGDRFQVGLVGQNFTDSPTDGTMSLTADALVLLDPGAHPVTLAQGGASAANWTAVAAQTGVSLVTSTLQTAAGGDIVEMPLPIKPFAAPDRWATAGQANPIANVPFNVPYNAVNTASKLTVRLSPSLALGVLDGLDELIDYPYGCVEQTMSRLLPSAVAAQAYADLGLVNPKAEQLPEIVSTGLQKLYGYQHDDGSWGWFYDDNGGAYMTSYVLFGLVSVQNAGFAVDPTVLDKGFDFLDSAITVVTDPNTLAFATYVKTAASRGDAAAALALVAQSDQLDPAGLATLALALHGNGDDGAAQAMLDKLATRVVETGSMAYWPLPQHDWAWQWWQTMPSMDKNTALAVRALAALRPDHPLLPKAVRWLMEHRVGAGWSSTQATAFAVLGLVDTLRTTGELQSNYSYVVKLNGVELTSGQVTPQTATAPLPALVVSGGDLHLGENELTIERSAGPGVLFYSAQLVQQLFYDDFAPVTSVDQGLKLSRSYQLVEGAPRADGAYNVGDLVEVKLTLDVTEDLSYVIVEDPLPAGFEGVEERMNPAMYGDLFWGWSCWGCWGYNQKSVRDDRVEFFVTQLWPGQHTYTYLMRASTPGEFSVMPGQAYPMYRDEIWARSPSQRVSIAPEQLAPRPALAGDFDHSCVVGEFDTQLVAAAWGTTAPNRNVVGDSAIDLRDVAAVGARAGADCTSDQALPGWSNQPAPFLVTVENTDVVPGDEFSATVTVGNGAVFDASSRPLDGFGVTLKFDPVHLRVADVIWNPALGNTVPLGPVIDDAKGVIRVGAFDLPANMAPGQPLMTVVFQSMMIGESRVVAKSAEAVDQSGRSLDASVTGSGSIDINGEAIYLPAVTR